MVTKKYSELAVATAVTDDDYFSGNDGATTKMFPPSVVKDYMTDGLLPPTALISTLDGYGGVPGVTMVSTNVETQATETNRLYLTPFLVPVPITVTQIDTECTTAVGSSTMRMAILTANADWEINQTDAIRWQASVDTATTGLRSHTSLSVVLPAGPYYQAWAGSTTAIKMRCYVGHTVNTPFSRAGLRARLARTASGSSALADPIGTISTLINTAGYEYPLLLRWTVN